MIYCNCQHMMGYDDGDDEEGNTMWDFHCELFDKWLDMSDKDCESCEHYKPRHESD